MYVSFCLCLLYFFAAGLLKFLFRLSIYRVEESNILIGVVGVVCVWALY